MGIEQVLATVDIGAPQTGQLSGDCESEQTGGYTVGDSDNLMTQLIVGLGDCDTDDTAIDELGDCNIDDATIDELGEKIDHLQFIIDDDGL